MKSKIKTSIKLYLFALVIALGAGYAIGSDFDNFVAGLKGEPAMIKNQETI